MKHNKNELHFSSQDNMAPQSDTGDGLETLNELIRNITQLTAKNGNGKPMEKLYHQKKKKNNSQPPTTTMTTTTVTSTTRVIADETDKVATRSFTPSTTTTETTSERSNSSSSTTEGATDGIYGISSTIAPLLVTQSRQGQSHKEVHTEVDKDNRKIEVVYAESVKQATTTTTPTTTAVVEPGRRGWKMHLNGNRVHQDQDDTVTEAVTATVQPTLSTAMTLSAAAAADDEGLKRDDDDDDDIDEGAESPPTPPEVTTPLIPITARPVHDVHHRRRQQQKLLLRKHLEQRNSLLTVLNATTATTDDDDDANGPLLLLSTTSSLDNATKTTKELARVADALKALRNLAALCSNNNNNIVKGNRSSSSSGRVGHKCLNRTQTPTASGFALDRRNRVENVLARTHEEVAARTEAASQSRRQRKLRVCAVSENRIE